MKQQLGLLAVILTILGSSVAAGEKPTTNLTARLTIDLTDGTHLIGTPNFDHFNVTTEYAKLNLTLAQVRMVEFNNQDSRARILLNKGDRLTGELTPGELPVQTVFGKVSVPLRLITRLTSYSSSPVLDHLILHYTFDNIVDGMVVDESGNTPPAKIKGATLTPQGKNRTGLQFDNPNDQLTFSDAKLPKDNAPRTVMIWLKTATSDTHNQVPFLYGTHKPGSSVFLVILENSTVLTLGNHSKEEPPGSQVVTDNVWHHAALTFDGDHTVKVYIDGRLDSTISRTYQTSLSGSANLSWTAPGEHNYQGILDDFMVFDKGLSEDEVLAIYTSQQ